jgi:hypothetical protein
MIEPAPIFLLKNDEADGPYDIIEIEEMIENGNLKEHTFSCIEGMKGWRSVPETVFWSYGKLLNLFLDHAIEMTNQMASNRLEIREARSKIRDALSKANCFKYSEAPEALSQVLYVNGCLLQHHQRYLARQQDWDVDAMEFYPASRISFFGRQQLIRDWDAEWQKSGPMLKGKMVAKKGAAVWLEISDFAFPFPPFSMDTSVWIEDVSIDEATRLGVPDINLPVVLPNIKQFQIIGP